jgi:hypothetical protein
MGFSPLALAAAGELWAEAAMDVQIERTMSAERAKRFRRRTDNELGEFIVGTENFAIINPCA